MTIIPLHEPHFLNPGVSADEERPAHDRWEVTLLLMIVASAIICGLAIVGGFDIFHRVTGW